MYRWMGSAMRPRPWYVSIAPFMRPSVSARWRVQAVAIDGAHADDLHPVVAPHGDVDGVAGLAPPHLLVELFLRGDVHAVDADDQVAPTEAGGPRRAGLVEAVDDDAAGPGRRVEADPRAGPAAHYAPGRQQLVLHRQEFLDGNRQAHVGRLAQAEGDDADHPPALVDGGAAAPRRHRGR